MNAHSSRSHAICTLSFELVRPATEKTEETVTSSQFHLVDLAGSERAKKTGAEVRKDRGGDGGTARAKKFEGQECGRCRWRLGQSGVPGVRFCLTGLLSSRVQDAELV